MSSSLAYNTAAKRSINQWGIWRFGFFDQRRQSGQWCCNISLFLILSSVTRRPAGAFRILGSPIARFAGTDRPGQGVGVVIKTRCISSSLISSAGIVAPGRWRWCAAGVVFNRHLPAHRYAGRGGLVSALALIINALGMARWWPSLPVVHRSRVEQQNHRKANRFSRSRVAPGRSGCTVWRSLRLWHWLVAGFGVIAA